MKFVIITHVVHTKGDGTYFAYGPYVKEMNIWNQLATSVEIVAPEITGKRTQIDLNYTHPNLKLSSVKSFNLVGTKNKFKAFFSVFSVIFTVFKAMKNADHIHLRCPGNVGLLGCFVQMFFPKKPKTAKYAGNWDPNAKQPFTYKLQRWILSNTFLTKNMQVLVYGEWANQSKNIKPFFTASYAENEKEAIVQRDFQGRIELIFVGTLSDGKQPLYAIQIVNELVKKGYDIRLRIFGEGLLRQKIERYVNAENISNFVILEGNQNREVLKKAYQSSHVLLLPSKSEGWPKAVAEAMFWGCVPFCTPVSCVPTMLDNEKRGVFLEKNLEIDTQKIQNLFNTPKKYICLSKNGATWSRQFTIDYFESEIKKLMT